MFAPAHAFVEARRKRRDDRRRQAQARLARFAAPDSFFDTTREKRPAFFMLATGALILVLLYLLP